MSEAVGPFLGLSRSGLVLEAMEKICRLQSPSFEKPSLYKWLSVYREELCGLLFLPCPMLPLFFAPPRFCDHSLEFLNSSGRCFHVSKVVQICAPVRGIFWKRHSYFITDVTQNTFLEA